MPDDKKPKTDPFNLLVLVLVAGVCLMVYWFWPDISYLLRQPISR